MPGLGLSSCRAVAGCGHSTAVGIRGFCERPCSLGSRKTQHGLLPCRPLLAKQRRRRVARDCDTQCGVWGVGCPFPCWGSIEVAGCRHPGSRPLCMTPSWLQRESHQPLQPNSKACGVWDFHTVALTVAGAVCLGLRGGVVPQDSRWSSNNSFDHTMLIPCFAIGFPIRP